MAIALFAGHDTNLLVKYFISLIIIWGIIFVTTGALAKPPRGFHTGPYLLAEGGVTQADFDYDQYSQLKIGNEWEPMVGIAFGWNIWDWFAAELEGRYSTNKTSGRREHLISARLNAKYFFIMDALTDFPTLRIMPTVQAGAAFRIAVLPGNPNTTDTTVTTFGGGPSIGAGLTCLWKKYFTFGFIVEEDLIFFQDVHQDLTVNNASVPGALIYGGGFKPLFSVVAFVGVHY